MARLAIVALLAFFLAAAAAQHPPADFEFVMRFMGSCKFSDKSYFCQGKGTSERMEVQIDQDHAVLFEVRPMLGPVAQWNVTGTMDASGGFDETGVISFGTYQNLAHSFTYSGSGKSIVIGSDTLSVGLLGSVTGGAGAFVGVNGTLTYSMRSDSDFSDWTAYVNVVANKQ